MKRFAVKNVINGLYVFEDSFGEEPEWFSESEANQMIARYNVYGRKDYVIEPQEFSAAECGLVE